MNDKVAIVTGSSAGIGLAIAKSLAKAGAAVVINGRTLEKLKSAEAEIEAEGGRVLGIQGDAFSEAEIKRIVKETVEYFGQIDILVNNAATVGVGQTVENMPIEVWDETLSGNLRSVFLFCKFAIPYLKKNASGRVINIGGLSGKNPLPFAAADACSKAGLMALTRVLAAELGPSGITVNTVIPGFQPNTDIGQVFNEKLSEAFHISPEDSVAGTKMKTLLKRFETTEEIGETVAFLCSNSGAAITGQNLNVNCGLATY